MRQDELPVDQLPGSWRRATNKQVNRKDLAISNEMGADDITPTIGGTGTAAYPTAKKIIGEIITSSERILFFGTTVATASEIGRLKSDGKYYPIIKDATSKIVLNFNQNFPIHGVSEQKYNGNTLIAWTDHNNNPFILNIDCLPFRLDGDFTVTSADVSKAQALIKMFAPYGTPQITPGNLDVLDGQGALTSGVYYPMMRYEAADGSSTSWSKIYNGVPIAGISLGQAETTMTGGVMGDLTSKAIEITFTNVDTNYKKITVGYIYVAKGVTRAFYEKSYVISSTGTVVTLIDGGTRTEITTNEALVPNIVYSKVKAVAAVQKILHLGGVEYSDELNFQHVANVADVKWVRNISSNIIYVNGTARSGYSNGENVFFNKSFKYGECYALYIAFILKTGVRTKAFHIPGRDALAGDRDVMNVAPGDIYGVLDNDADVYKYQVKNTITTTNASIQEGKMGFWENEDEQYPLDPANLANIHPDFSNVPGISVGARKVRHHVFPDVTFLDDVTYSTNGDQFAFPLSGFGATPHDDVITKPLGLKITIEIPSPLLELVDSWEIFYAERNNSNIRILGSDLATNESGAQYLRFQQFDLMVSKPNLVPTYVKPLCRWTTLTTPNAENLVEYMDTHSIEHLADASLFSNVLEWAYLGENTTGLYNNAGFADTIIAKINPVVAMSTGVDGIAKDCVLFDLCIFKRNMYLGFNNQTLVSAGPTRKAVASGHSLNLFGGDVHIGRHAVNTLNTGTVAFHFVCESAANIPYRHEDAAQSKYFAPKYSNPTPSWFGYDTGYNAQNKFNILSIFYPADSCIDGDVVAFPQRIARSLTEGTENKTVNWRIFKANSYYDMPKDKGIIWSMTGGDRTLYIHHENALFLAEIKDSLNTADGEEIAALGITDLFDRPPIEIVPTKQGYGGTQSQYAITLCELGYCYIDRQQAAIYILPQGSTKPIKISDQGMSNFFTEHAESNEPTVDNPFIGKGYTMAYDSYWRRLIICKQDGVFSYTISYCPDLNEGNGGWVSFHDYRPNYISNNREGLFAFDNSASNSKLFEHNSITKKCKYYDGVIKESSVDVVFNDAPEKTKNFDNANWITTVEAPTVKYENETATHLLVYNDTQSTDKIDLAKSSKIWYGRDARNTEETWNFNNFRDLVKDTTTAFLDARLELVTGNIDANKSWYNKSKFISKFVVVRLIYSNASQKDFHISYVGSNFKRSDR